MSIRNRNSAVVTAIVCLTAGSWCSTARAVTIDFDGVANGTVINSFYAGLGVSFNNPLGVSASNPSSPSIFARSSASNASPGNVVSVFGTGVPAYDSRYGAVEAVFSTPQRRVSIDAAILRLPEGLSTPLNAPKLEIYGAGGAFITAVSWDFALIAQPGAGGITGFQTLSYLSNAADITKVRLLSGNPGASPSNFGLFDNLNFTTAVPEPSTALLFGLGALAISAGWARRRLRS